MFYRVFLNSLFKLVEENIHNCALQRSRKVCFAVFYEVRVKAFAVAEGIEERRLET